MCATTWMETCTCWGWSRIGVMTPCFLRTGEINRLLPFIVCQVRIAFDSNIIIWCNNWQNDWQYFSIYKNWNCEAQSPKHVFFSGFTLTNCIGVFMWPWALPYLSWVGTTAKHQTIIPPTFSWGLFFGPKSDIYLDHLAHLAKYARIWFDRLEWYVYRIWRCSRVFLKFTLCKLSPSHTTGGYLWIIYPEFQFPQKADILDILS